MSSMGKSPAGRGRATYCFNSFRYGRMPATIKNTSAASGRPRNSSAPAPNVNSESAMMALPSFVTSATGS